MPVSNGGRGMLSGNTTKHRAGILNALSCVLMLSCATAVHAEVKVIETDSTYIIGDNVNVVEASRIAVQEARRRALDQAVASVENLTSVKNYQLTRDEIKAYTAGGLQTELQSEQAGPPEHPEISVRTKSSIDTDVLAAQIERYRKNEVLEDQLKAAYKENEDLKKRRDWLIRQLSAQDKTKAEETRKKLDRVLSQEEANDETNGIWATLGNKLEEGEDSGGDIQQADLDNAIPVLEHAVSVNPQNQRAHYLLASVYQKNGNPDAAENQLRTAIRSQPSNPATHMMLGMLLREDGRYQEALKEFHFVERLRPHYLPAVFFVGMTFKDMDKCGKAVQNLNRFLKDKRVDTYPRKKEAAGRAIEECGGARPGRQRHLRQG